MTNIIAMDQEKHGLAVVMNGGEVQYLKSIYDLELPEGGGFIVADGNSWGVGNDLSVSQFVFPALGDRTSWVLKAAELGFASLSISNKRARTIYQTRGYSAVDAVIALYEEVAEHVERHGRFDSGKPVREPRGDISRGMRDVVTKDFLRLQNSGGYFSNFMDGAVKALWDELDSDEKKLLNLKIRTPEASSHNRVAAIVVCTHDPVTGEVRTYRGRTWGKRFIIRNIIGLNGTMQGTGTSSPGNPMRAVLRILGRRWGDKTNKEERSQLDRLVKKSIGILQKHSTLG